MELNWADCIQNCISSEDDFARSGFWWWKLAQKLNPTQVIVHFLKRPQSMFSLTIIATIADGDDLNEKTCFGNFCVKINQNIHYFEHVSLLVESHTTGESLRELRLKDVSCYCCCCYFLLIKWQTEKIPNTMFASTCWYSRVWDWCLFLTQFAFMTNFKCLYEYKLVNFAHLMIRWSSCFLWYKFKQNANLNFGKRVDHMRAQQNYVK